MLPQLPYSHWLLFALGLAVASGWDVRQRRIPNIVIVAISMGGLGARFFQMGFLPGAWGVAGLVAGLSLLIYPFARRWIGAADVKLLGACGAWMGPLLVVYGAALAALWGLILSLWYWFRAPQQTRRDIWTNLKFVWLIHHIPDIEDRPPGESPPYALAISLGALSCLAAFYFGMLAKLGLLNLAAGLGALR